MKPIIPNMAEIDDMEPWEPARVPKGWHRMHDIRLDPYKLTVYEYQLLGLLVTLSIDTSRGIKWKHACISMRFLERLPTWEEISKVKRDFFGDVEAIQVFPRKRDYVNICKNALHIWSPTEE